MDKSTPKVSKQVKKISWVEFRESGLLWWVNRILHTFGWAIVLEIGKTGKVTDVYPARVKYRGFSYDAETTGFRQISKHLSESQEAFKDGMRQ